MAIVSKFDILGGRLKSVWSKCHILTLWTVRYIGLDESQGLSG